MTSWCCAFYKSREEASVGGGEGGRGRAGLLFCEIKSSLILHCHCFLMLLFSEVLHSVSVPKLCFSKPKMQEVFCEHHGGLLDCLSFFFYKNKNCRPKAVENYLFASMRCILHIREWGERSHFKYWAQCLRGHEFWTQQRTSIHGYENEYIWGALI